MIMQRGRKLAITGTALLLFIYLAGLIYFLQNISLNYAPFSEVIFYVYHLVYIFEGLFLITGWLLILLGIRDITSGIVNKFANL